MEIAAYSSVMAKVLPKSFVPDISATSDAPNTELLPSVAAAAGENPSFKNVVKSYLEDINTKLNTSDEAVRNLATGESDDVSGTAVKVQEANLALNMAMSVRNKLIDAYTEIDHMSV